MVAKKLCVYVFNSFTRVFLPPLFVLPPPTNNIYVLISFPFLCTVVALKAYL